MALAKILADYTACYPDRPQDQKSTIQKEQFTSKENVTHSIKSGKCGTFSVRDQKLKSNRCPKTTSLITYVFLFTKNLWHSAPNIFLLICHPGIPRLPHPRFHPHRHRCLHQNRSHCRCRRPLARRYPLPPPQRKSGQILLQVAVSVPREP